MTRLPSKVFNREFRQNPELLISKSNTIYIIP